MSIIISWISFYHFVDFAGEPEFLLFLLCEHAAIQRPLDH